MKLEDIREGDVLQVVSQYPPDSEFIGRIGTVREVYRHAGWGQPVIVDFPDLRPDDGEVFGFDPSQLERVPPAGAPEDPAVERATVGAFLRHADRLLEEESGGGKKGGLQ
jgi:hypothetical protein